jgi:hypothetical protein
MYFEVWIDLSKREEVLKKLRDICDEVHEVFYDYQLIVRIDDEQKLEMDGILRYRKHYNC